MTEAEAGPEAETEEAFLNRIKPELEQMEVMREVKLAAYLSRQKMIWPVTAVVIACTLALDVFITKHLFKSSFPIFPFCSVLAAFGLVFWTGQPRKDYVSIYKDNITPRIARLVGLDIYQREGMIPIMDLTGSNLIPAHQHYLSEDYFEGSYKGARLRFAQVRFDAQRPPSATFGSREAAKPLAVIFRGLVLVINLPKKRFTGHTILVKNKDHFAEWLTAKLNGLQPVPLANPAFEKTFSVFSKNREEADKLIDGTTLARVAELSDLYKSQGVSIAFYGAQVVMLIAADKDFFEPANIATPATNVDAVRSIRRELQEVFGLIDDCGLLK